jgi:DNA invertase Pin-like site-specific DNA recombinase
VQALISFLSELQALSINLFLHQQGLDRRRAARRCSRLGMFAEVERAMIQERVRAELARARAQGKQLGRLKVTAPQRLRLMRVTFQKFFP